MNDKKPGLFVLADGRNVFFTFLLVSSLFVLWGFCNRMIDVMDKHFQTELKLTPAQSCNGIGWIFGPIAGGMFFYGKDAGGAILPKLMGHVGDLHGMSRAFIVPLVCFAFVSYYGYAWPRLSGSDRLGGRGVKIEH